MTILITGDDVRRHVVQQRQSNNRETAQAGMLIDELHMIAAEMGITLIEAD